MDLITDDSIVRAAMERARSLGRIGLDTEFMREKTYRARLCLVQIATAEDLILIDALEVDLAPLADAIADPNVQIIVHAGKQDLHIFYERYGSVPSNVMDIQMAAAFAGLGASLPYGRLVDDAIGVKLEKGESYSDWCARPLSEAQLRYAADDVRYLLEIDDVLQSKLQEQGRLDWAMQELASLEDEASYALDPGDMWRKVGGRGSLNPKATRILRAVAGWREEEAARRDIPRGWVIKDPTLIEIARRAPRSVAALRTIRGMNEREAERSGAALIKAIQEGTDAEGIASPPGPSRQAQTRARMLLGLADAVVRARCEKARIAPELVATRGELESLIAEVTDQKLVEDRHRLLTGWRRELAGSAVLDVAEGRIGVKAISRPPFVEEIPLET